MSCLRDYIALWPYGSADIATYIHEIQLASENSWDSWGLAKYGLCGAVSHVVVLITLWVFSDLMMAMASWWDCD